MPIKIRCPNPACGREANVPDDRAGHALRCKSCGTRFTTSRSTGEGQPPSRPGSEVVTPPRLTIGRYQVREKLGSGAFGTVYRAYDPQLDREVALKVLRPEALASHHAVERFQREARAAAKMHHPHIVPVYDAGQHGDQFFIASAFIGGRTLSAAIPEQGMDALRAGRLAMHLAEALGYAHLQGILHRDVKPGNIMLDEQDVPYLMDFGMASWTEQAGSRLTRLGAVLGTPAFMAPEQAKGDSARIGPASDLYSAGVVLYEMLTGRVPFEGPVAVIVYQVIHSPAPPLSQSRSDLDAGLEAICQKAMAKQPEQRFANGEEMAAALRAWLLVQGSSPRADRSALLPAVRPIVPALLDETSKNSIPVAGRSSRFEGADLDSTAPSENRKAPVTTDGESFAFAPIGRANVSPTQAVDFGREPTRRRTHRPMWLVLGGAVLVFGMLIVGLLALMGRPDPGASTVKATVRNDREQPSAKKVSLLPEERKKDPVPDEPPIDASNTAPPPIPQPEAEIAKWIDDASNPAARRLNRDIARHKEFLRRSRSNKGEGDVIFLGDSITHGWEGQAAWKEYFGEFNPVNLGIGGDQTGHVLWRITEGKELENLQPKAAVIMIGTNNTYGHSAEQIAGGIKAIVEELKRQKPRMKILVLGVFPRGSRSDVDMETKTIPAAKLSKEIPAINAIISKLADGKTVFYKDIGKDFLTPEGGLSGDIMPDYLHLSGKGYAIWGKAIKGDLEKLVK